MPEVISSNGNSTKTALQKGIELQGINTVDTQQQQVPPGTLQISYSTKEKSIELPEWVNFVWLLSAIDFNGLCIVHQALNVVVLIVKGNGTKKVMYYFPWCIIAGVLSFRFVLLLIVIAVDQISR